MLKKHVLKIALFCGFGIIFLPFNGCKEESKASAIKPIEVKFQKEGELQLKKAKTDSLLASLDIEIADDDYQTQTGLMYRHSMAANRGMLFIFPESEMRSFYMKNTQFALDIIYIDENKSIVSIQKNAKAMDEGSLPSEAPAKYVLEVNAGLSDAWGLELGDLAVFDLND
jgi:hypothetical protein